MNKHAVACLLVPFFSYLSLCLPAMADEEAVKREILRQESMKEEIYQEMREHLSAPCTRNLLGNKADDEMMDAIVEAARVSMQKMEDTVYEELRWKKSKEDRLAWLEVALNQCSGPQK